MAIRVLFLGGAILSHAELRRCRLVSLATGDKQGLSPITYVTRLCPVQPMWRTMLMHLFVECSLADPVFRLTAHTKRKPSFTSPRVARYWELGLKETLRTPTVCSVRIDRGISGDASFAVEKIKTRGLYPVYAQIS